MGPIPNEEICPMRRSMWMVVALALVVGGVGQAMANPFINPPETNWNPPWVTPFPYQRNIDWDFSAISPVGGPSTDGTPGAVYEGWLDPSLKSSDYVTFSGGFQWYPSITVGSSTYGGVIGISNTTDSASSAPPYSISITRERTRRNISISKRSSPRVTESYLIMIYMAPLTLIR